MMLLALWGCRPTTSCEPGPVREPATLAVSLTDQRFTAGSLGLVESDLGIEPVQQASADAIVRTDGSVLYVVDRSERDVVTAYDPASPRCPLWETALPELSNAHDLVAFADRLWVPTFGTGSVHVLDPVDGSELDVLELGGTPDRAVVHDGELWVADQRFSVDERRDGRLVRIDGSGSVLGEVQTGPNPRITPDDDSLLVATGWYAFAQSTYAADLVDGRLQRFRSDGSWEELVSEAELGGDLHTVVAGGGRVGVVSVDAEARSTLHCLGDAWVEGPTDAGWLLTGVVLPDRWVFGVRSTLYANETATAEPGLLSVDPVSCSATEFVPSELEPYDLVAL